MRVLLLSKAMVVGTYQRKAEEIAALPGIELTVAVPPRWDEPRVGSTVLERRHVRGYRLVVLPMWLNGHFHLHFYPGLRRLVKQIRPDIFHIDEESFNLVTWQAMRQGVAAGAYCCFYNYANIARRYPPPFAWFERYNFHHAAAALVANHEAASIIQSHGYHGPVHVVPQFGVDPELFTPADPPLRPAPFRIGYFGRLVPEKGVLDLLQAVAQLPASAQLIIVGRGEQEATIRSEIGRLGLGERVTLQPMVPSAEVAGLMRQLHVVAVPSRTTPRWKEQFGRVLVEAMACGVPPVGSDSGEIPHVIGDGGLVFPEGDAGALAAHLQRLMDDTRLREELAARGRRRVLAHYTQAAVARRHVVIYEQMLRGKL